MYVNTHYQSADIFTKSLPSGKWAGALALLGMDTTPPEAESPAAGVEANPQPAAKVPTKPKQECGMPLPVRGASAACIACDDCLALAVDQVSNQAITDSVKIAGANIKAAMSKPKPHRARPSGKLKHWGEVFEI